MFHFWIKIAMKHLVIAKQKNKKIFNKNLKPFSEFQSACFFPTPFYAEIIVIVDKFKD